MTVTVIEPLEAQDPHSLAEWIEIAMLAEGMTDFSTSEIAQEFASGQRPPAADIELALAIIDSRAIAGPSVYPLRRVGGRVVRAGHPDSGVGEIDPCIYLFLLISCLKDAPWIRANQAEKVGSLFDYPVLEAMRAWMGPESRGIVFGWPPRDGRPSEFSDALSWLADVLQLPDGDMDRPRDDKDGGVDTVVWKPAADGRSGFPIWLVQASVEHDVVDKASRVIPVESWKRWIKFGAGVVTVFATAQSVPPGSSTWMKLNDLAFQICDRTRLLEWLDAARVMETRPVWYEELCVFANTQLDSIRAGALDVDVGPSVRRPKRERQSEHADPRAR